jgi:predicted nucleic-acid-binding Zn-ribbon protein
MRTSGRCPKCDGKHLLHVLEVADAGRQHDSKPGEPREHLVEGIFNRFRIARIPNPDPGFFDDRVAAIGLVEAYVCRACGFTELYTRHADKIHADGRLVREVVGEEPPEEGPYR